MGSHDRITAGEPRQARDLHLCNNLRHLFFAVCDIMGTGRRSLILYLEDDRPLPAALRRRLEQLCPQAAFSTSTDAREIAAFARLPEWVPSILRRNVSFGGRFGLMRAFDARVAALDAQTFDIGYIYHPGFFTAKAVARRCRRVVMRESGLNNHVVHKMPLSKAVLRGLAGLKAREQVWGEERWIDGLEVADPARLPARVRAKARPVSIAQIRGRVPASQARALAEAFAPERPALAPDDRVRALVLTQPLDAIDICSEAQKIAVYQNIADRLRRVGYAVYVKPHPGDGAFSLSNATMLRGDFPIELWPFLGMARFDLALALCSASLAEDDRTLARHVLQLLHPDQFNPRRFAAWPGLLEEAMAKILPPQAIAIRP